MRFALAGSLLGSVSTSSSWSLTASATGQPCRPDVPLGASHAPLAGADRDLVVIGLLGIAAPADGAGDGNGLGGIPGVVLFVFDELGQLVDGDEVQVRQAARGGKAEGIEPQRRIRGQLELHLEL